MASNDFILIITVGSLIVCFTAYLYAQIIISRKNKEIKKLSKQLQQLTAPSNNQRKHFRLKLDLDDVILTFKQMNQGAFKRLENKKAKVKILDLSAGGAKIYCDLDVPIKESMLVNLDFHLRGVHFTLNGRIIRKETLTDYKTNVFNYGIEFIITHNDRARLNNLLNHIAVEKHKKAKLE
ncbi:PilZ domain-containing protein [Desertibacillus haloalkaliphilus]|uniref:PilZ domain-containing protein n=1 Tax=Desertibacillus haloalkaliphilus TaxID=1328930 RepID=UPI001C270410|nr:PilZ domain-containing protein [Desertibacillus haloalkaliphilus]MBU8907848.1 PilZ domain-containing protein [Desertibacillus haloalkaliphilus]